MGEGCEQARKSVGMPRRKLEHRCRDLADTGTAHPGVRWGGGRGIKLAK